MSLRHCSYHGEYDDGLSLRSSDLDFPRSCPQCPTSYYSSPPEPEGYPFLAALIFWLPFLWLVWMAYAILVVWPVVEIFDLPTVKPLLKPFVVIVAPLSSVGWFIWIGRQKL